SRFEGDGLMSEVFFRVAGIEDMAAFLILKGSVYVEPVRISGLGQGLADGHGVLGELADGTPVAGRFQRPICPDLLGDGLMVVRPAYQGRGLGRACVEFWEETCPERFTGSIVANSDLYKSARKPPATGF